MLVRIVTAVVGIPLFLGLLYIGDWPLFALVAGMGLIGFHEYARMWRAKGVQVAYLPGSLFILGIFLWAFVTPDNSAILGALVAAAVVVSFTWVVFRFKKRTALDALITIAGVVYVGWLLSHLLLLRGLGSGKGWDLGLKWVTMAFVCTWTADSVAYFVGRAFGKRKLAPHVSPNKSVEGAAGGAVATVVVAGTLASVVGMSLWEGALLGVTIYVFSVLGDLAESTLKRYTGVKDSGTLLPGHGGVLDRFDSTLFVLPLVYYTAKFFYL